jgi:hypothetical protein
MHRRDEPPRKVTFSIRDGACEIRVPRLVEITAGGVSVFTVPLPDLAPADIRRAGDVLDENGAADVGRWLRSVAEAMIQHRAAVNPATE